MVATPLLSAELLELLDVPVALLEADGVTVRWTNQSFRTWAPLMRPGQSLASAITGFGSARAQRGLASHSDHSVPGRAPDRRGRVRDVEYRRRSIELNGESLWLVEGLDRSKAEVKQTLLDTHARTIERNNRQLARREAALESHNAAMQRVLDNTTDGLFVVDMHGMVDAQRSRICERWFGKTGRMKAVDLLAGFDVDAAAWFDVAFEAVTARVLPPAFTIAQLPTKMSKQGQHLSLRYVPIVDGDQLEHVLVVVTDVTAELEQARAKAHEQDMLELTRRLLRDRSGLEQFMLEIDTMLESLISAQPSREEVTRLLHTIKGNCALFGANAISSICHAIESEVVSSGDAPSEEALCGLRDEWNELARPVRSILGSGDRFAVELCDRELTAFLDAMGHCEAEQVRLIAMSWRNPPVRNMLTLLGEQAVRLGQRVRKPVEFVVRDHGLRLPLKQWRAFWSSLNHVIRNAVDHGIEDSEGRISRGKAVRGLVTLETNVENDCIVIRLSDDGNGVDWDLVAAKRRARLGVVDVTREDLVAELLTNGFSTRDSATEVSGRGIGLDAVAMAARAVGATVAIRSVPGQGTTFEFCFRDAQLVSLARASRVAFSRVAQERLNQGSGLLGDRDQFEGGAIFRLGC